jgi:hypothetical protein
MSLPSSFARILAVLKRLSPAWPSTDPDKSVGKELGSIAVALGMAADIMDAILDELFPDTTTLLIDRWEKITRNPVRVGDDITTRRARVLATLRRLSGPRIAQLESALAPVLDTDVSNLFWVEQERSFIEEPLTETTGVVALAVPATAPPLTVKLGKPYPGVVDDFGVKVYLDLSSVGTSVATLTSPSGTVWTIPVTSSGWYQTREVFTGEPAGINGGLWTLSIYDSSAPTLNEFQLLVSNNVDSGRIYQFFVLRDPGLPGTADLIAAQRLFKRMALGNMRAFVVETLAFKTGDTYSRLGRDPLGV